MTPGVFGTWKGEGKPNPDKCKARVSDHDSRWPRYYQCKSNQSRDGWCERHHPDKLEAKEKARDAAAKRQRVYSDYLYERKERRNKIADAAIEGRFQDMKMLVDEFKDFEAKKPPVVSLPAWERGAF